MASDEQLNTVEKESAAFHVNAIWDIEDDVKQEPSSCFTYNEIPARQLNVPGIGLVNEFIVADDENWPVELVKQL